MVLKDRPHSKEAILITSPLLTVSQSLSSKTGVFKIKEKVPVMTQTFHIEVDEVDFKY